MTPEQTAIHERLEQQRQALQALHDAEKTARERNVLGQFATPFPLAQEVTRAAIRLLPTDAPIHFGEPSCGSGAFFSALTSLHAAPQIASATGFEIDPAYAQVARELWASRGLRVVEDDFTKAALGPAAERPTLILANPPYVRHHHLGPDKERLQRLAKQATGIAVNGLAGLYVYFMLISHEWLQDDGLSSWLIPSEFMDVNYGTALKAYLTEKVSLLSLHRFDPSDRQFEDALVSSAVVTFRKTLPGPETTATFSFGGHLDAPTVSQRVTIRELKATRKWTALPERPGSSLRARAIDGLLLGDLFAIKRGIATGANAFFILKRAEAQALGLEEEALRPVLPSPRHLKQKRVECAPDGHPAIDPQLVLIDCDRPPHEVEEFYPNLWHYLQGAEEKGIHAGYLVGKRRPWYKQEQRPPAPFLCTYMGRAVGHQHPFRFILNRSQAVATNLFLTLYPKEMLAHILRDEPAAVEEVFGLLNQIDSHSLRGEGRVYGGGLHKIEPKELACVSASIFVNRFPQMARGSVRQLSLVLERKTRPYAP